MISDPKLPCAGDSTSVGESGGEFKSPDESSTPLGPVPVPARPPSGVRLWLRRIGVLLFVFLCATLGVMLVILPWRPEWSENPLLIHYPLLHELMASGFTRGLATGLGVLNVWIGFWEAVQYRED